MMSAHTGTTDPSGDRSFDLHSVVVSYEHRPDRCTIYPRSRSHYERLETWLSADEDVFVSLREMR